MRDSGFATAVWALSRPPARIWRAPRSVGSRDGASFTLSRSVVFSDVSVELQDLLAHITRSMGFMCRDNHVLQVEQAQCADIAAYQYTLFVRLLASDKDEIHNVRVPVVQCRIPLALPCALSADI
ncbi:hypothetical protein PsYK624_080440 [Phanerochaete sordida]|uniref:Uncharacterized protein n=1 Tax=Phanerochaete sordida TaxID=48140 RepID=A0A9P3G9J3_9APHY|nr:hypothetical protein PsYK624_080440 [Phanerochaete sordida]